ncbi:MAG: hypothetical protein HY228_02600 [Candidatus Yonathbacteria bacterium]|nr:hypothetical protein [Candidatus Yonathbacteria bacterium]
MKTFLRIILGVSFFAPLIASAHIYDYTDGYGMYGMMGYGGGTSILFTLAIIVWIIVGILVSVMLWRKINRKDGGHQEK